MMMEVKLLFCLLLFVRVGVESYGTVVINYHQFDTKSKFQNGDYCDWYRNDCDAYFYFKYKECYSSYSSCGSQTTIRYYSGANSGYINQLHYYRTSNSFSGRIQVVVEVWDDDVAYDDHIATYRWNLHFSGSRANWYESTLYRNYGAYFKIRVKFYCYAHYYGSHCTKYCKARNDYYGHYTCNIYGTKICNRGWTGELCRDDYDECAKGTDTCNRITEVCVNLDNGRLFYCRCKTGYTLYGSTCYDINECSYENGGCSNNCTNNPGSFTCSCPSPTGYRLDSTGHNCSDINECKTNNGNCEHNCTNTLGSYYCSCSTGYTLFSDKHRCSDKEECANNTHSCQHYCINTVGSYRCSCRTGYTLNSNGTSCDDINECTLNSNNCNHICRNSIGSYTCSCYSGGYSLDTNGRTCSDINECNTNKGGCGHNCTNTQGSYYCTCAIGYTLVNTTLCVDTNECASSNGGCNQTCTNSIGSYSCSCLNGYYMLSDNKNCRDINECSHNTHGCEHYCLNSAGSYSCRCSHGYQLTSDNHTCEDINECNIIPRVCGQHCSNYEATYNCSCSSGYVLASDNTTCHDIDECVENRSLCEYPKKCVNKVGSYKCDCASGYNDELQDPQVSCVDINECTLGTHLCEQNCNNTIGNYTCSCNDNYYAISRYSCHIVTFTVSLIGTVLNATTVSLAWSTVFDPMTSIINTTSQIHSLDIKFGSGTYEAYSPIDSNTTILTELRPYRRYQFYVTASGKLYSADSNTLILQTPEDTPSTAPGNVRAVMLAPNSIRIEWSIPTIKQQNGIIVGYRIEYRLRAIGYHSNISIGLVSIYNLTGLNEYTEYEIRVAALTSIGAGPFSNRIIAKTHQSTPNSPPAIRVIGITAQSINITLTPPNIDSVNGILTNYQLIYYGESLDTNRKTLELTVVNAEESLNVSLTDLQENVLYYITARIFTVIGGGPYASTQYRTLPAPPSSHPLQLAFNDTQSNSVLVLWHAPEIIDYNSETISYRVEYYGNEFDTALRKVYTNATRFKLTALEEGELYTISVCTYNKLGDGLCSLVEVRTLEEIPIGVPQSLNAIALHDTAINIFWNPVPATEANGVIIKYQIYVQGTSHDNRTIFLETNTTILTVTNLEEYVVYRIQVRAVNSIGTGPYSNSTEVRTHEDAPTAAPRDLNGISYKTLIFLTWLPPSEPELNGVITQYEIQYTGRLLDSLDKTKTINNTTSCNLTGLQEDETYVIKIRAYTSIGYGPYSARQAIRTLIDVPSSSPQHVRTIVLSSRAIQVTWMHPEAIGQNGPITGYDIELRAVMGNYTEYKSQSGHVLLVTYTNLRPNRQYSLKVRANTIIGPGPFSSLVYTITNEDIPEGPPEFLHIPNITAHSATISWTPVSENLINGGLRHYVLILSSYTSTIKIEPSLTNYTLYGLDAFTDYTVKLAAETIAGRGPYSTLLAFTTAQYVPSVGPSIDSIHSITSTSFSIEWSNTLFTIRNGPIHHFEVVAREEYTDFIAFDDITNSSSYNSITVYNLNEYTNYIVSLVAINSAGSSPPTIITVQTAQDRPSSAPLDISTIIGETWIQVSWSPPDEQDRNGVIMGYEIHVNDEFLITNTSTSYKLTSLEQAILYTIQIGAITIIGTGPLSYVIEITTLSDIPSAPPSDLAATAIASDQIKVIWYPIPYLHQNGLLLDYRVYYAIADLNTTKFSVITLPINVTRQVIIKSLVPYTYYNIYVVATNVNGTSPQTNTTSIQTLQDTPSVAPGNFEVHILSATSLNLSWSPIPLEQVNGILTHYTIRYNGDVIDTNKYNINIKSNQTLCTIKHLRSSELYTLSVDGSTLVGNGPMSDQLMIKLPDALPTAAPDFTALHAIATGLYAKWNEIPLGLRNGDIIRYDVVLSVVSNYTLPDHVSNSTASNTTNTTMTTTTTDIRVLHLQASTKYVIKVRGVTSAGPGPFSIAIQAATAPQNLECFGYFNLYRQDPCQNGANCLSYNEDDFTCDCVPGYEGVLCQDKIIGCMNNPCLNGECEDHLNSYSCSCFPGYTGEHCETEIMECDMQPCMNGGTCITYTNSYQCLCPDEFSGDTCQYPNMCLTNPCLHGTCSRNEDKYSCKCDIGYSGPDCKYNINDCEGITCQNSGTCKDGLAKFDCQCSNGYKGRYCQLSSDVLVCEQEQSSKVNWPATEYSSTAVMPCQYIDTSYVDGNATRDCLSDGEWGDPDLTQCERIPFHLLTMHLQAYTNVFAQSGNIDSNNISEVILSTAYIVCDKSIMSPREIELTLNLTEQAFSSLEVLDFQTKKSLISTLNDKIICIISAIVSPNNMELFSKSNIEDVTRVLNLFKLYSTLNAKIFDNSSCLTISSDNVQLHVIDLNTVISSSGYNTVVSNCNQSNDTLANNSISIPNDLITGISANAEIIMSIIISPTLGHLLTTISSGKFSSYSPASVLIMVELDTELPKHLTDPIQLDLSILNTTINSYTAHKLYCVYWDPSSNQWSEFGVHLYDRYSNKVICSVTHLSTFIVLSEPLAIESTLAKLYISYATYALAGISIVAIVSSIVSIAMLGKKLLQSDIYIAQLNLFFAYGFYLISLLIAVLPFNYIQLHCDSVAIVVYYFALCFVTCFLSEGIAICFQFMLPKVKRRIYLFIILIDWLLPLPIAITRKVFDSDNLGIQDYYCWLSANTLLAWTMTEPILVFLFVIIILMILSIIRRITYKEVEHVIIARFTLSGHIIMFPLIAAPWIISIINFYREIGYYPFIFIVIVSLQGIIMFISYTICNKYFKQKCFYRKYTSEDYIQNPASARCNVDDQDINSVSLHNIENPFYLSNILLSNESLAGNNNAKCDSNETENKSCNLVDNVVHENTYSTVTKIKHYNPFLPVGNLPNNTGNENSVYRAESLYNDIAVISNNYSGTIISKINNNNNNNNNTNNINNISNNNDDDDDDDDNDDDNDIATERNDIEPDSCEINAAPNEMMSSAITETDINPFLSDINTVKITGNVNSVYSTPSYIEILILL